MTDERYCSTCSQFIDLDSCRIRFAEDSGNLIVTDKEGRAHTLLTAKKSATKIKQIARKIEPITVIAQKVPKVEAAEPPAVAAPTALSSTAGSSLTCPVPGPNFVEVEPEQPNPIDWYQVTVRFNNHQGRFLSASLENGSTVFVHYRDITNSPGRHFCRIAKGDLVAVRIKAQTGDFVDDYRAIEGVIDGDAWAESETGKIMKWMGTYGTIERNQCGCPIFAKVEDFEDYREGDIVQFDVQRNELKGWVASNLYLYKQETQ